MNWPIKKLGEVTDIYSGGTPRRSNPNCWGNDIPWLTMEDANKGFEVAGTVQYISNEGLQHSNAQLVPVGSVNLSCTASVGNVTINRIPLATNQQFNSFHPKQNSELLTEFLAYRLIFDRLKIQSLGRSTTFQFVSKSTISNFEIPIPHLDTQKKILKRLDAIKKAQELCDTQISKTEELFESILQEIEKIKGKSIKISDICLVKGGKRILKGLTFSSQHTDHPYLRVTNFKDNSIDIENLKFIDDPVFSKISNYIISKDDVYISIAGTTGLVGLIPDELDRANLTENAAKLVIKDKSKISKEYLMFCLLIPSNQYSFKAQTHNTSVQKLALFRIQDVEIKLPSTADQQKIVNRLNAIQKYKKQLFKQKSLLKELFDSVLYKSMNGEMDN